MGIKKNMIKGFKIPQVTFRIIDGDASDNEVACEIGGKWTNKSTDNFFKNKKLGIDEIYCCSVND